MSYFVCKNGQRIERHLACPATLAELLSDDEYARFQQGTLVAVDRGGSLLVLSSPLAEGQEVVLRPPMLEKDFSGYGFPINRSGEVVGISELMRIRAYEEEHETDLYDNSLAEIRERLAAWGSASAPSGFPPLDLEMERVIRAVRAPVADVKDLKQLQKVFARYLEYQGRHLAE